MKTFIKLAFYTTLLLLNVSVFAQNQTSEYDEVYPDTYTFTKALEFENKGQPDKALWFYINLFSDNKKEVVTLVKQLKKPDTLSLKQFIMYSFAIYAIFDPTISSMKDGQMQIDAEKLQVKGGWGDHLIACVVPETDTLLSAAQFNYRGNERCDKYDYAGAIKDYTRAIKLEPLAEYYFNRAYAKSSNQDYKEALIDYNKVISMKYKLSETYFERAYSYIALEMYKEAIADYTASINLDDTQKMSYYNRAYAEYALEQFKEALADYDRTIKIDKKYGAAYACRGLTKNQLTDKKGACNDWKKAVELEYSKAQAYIDKYCQ